MNLSWRTLDPTEVIDGVTSPLRTVLDCALTMPFNEALVIADPALRCGDVTTDELQSLPIAGRGAVSARRWVRRRILAAMRAS